MAARWRPEQCGVPQKDNEVISDLHINATYGQILQDFGIHSTLPERNDNRKLTATPLGYKYTAERASWWGWNGLVC